ncbi:hypothetical protein ZWY2020_000559 [Hordeum vulgare]|nr:hypothetical protein ZWY2020_000559 [Hordeum vulgare]
MLPTRAMASLLGHVETAPKDPILGVIEAFLADPMAGRDPPRRDRPEVKEVTGGVAVAVRMLRSRSVERGGGGGGGWHGRPHKRWGGSDPRRGAFLQI